MSEAQKLKNISTEQKETNLVNALTNFIERLKNSRNDKIKCQGTVIETHLERRFSEFLEAKQKNPTITISKWVTDLCANKFGDIVEGRNWIFESARYSNYYKKPGEFTPIWTPQEIGEILGKDITYSYQLEELMWKEVPEKVHNFFVGVQGDFGPGSEEHANASYVIRGVNVDNLNEKTAEIAVLLKIEVPHKDYGIGYAYEGAILGIGFKINKSTLEAFLAKKLNSNTR